MNWRVVRLITAQFALCALYIELIDRLAFTGGGGGFLISTNPTKAFELIDRMDLFKGIARSLAYWSPCSLRL